MTIAIRMAEIGIPRYARNDKVECDNVFEAKNFPEYMTFPHVVTLLNTA